MVPLGRNRWTGQNKYLSLVLSSLMIVANFGLPPGAPFITIPHMANNYV
jgi:hypothetical protein